VKLAVESVEKRLLSDVVARDRNPPVELPADASAVKAEIGRWLGARPNA
jgi:hypothetical protein